MIGKSSYLCLFVVAVAIGAATASLDPYPLVIAHRGSPEYVPEHSIAAYAIAIREGVDYIEPDLVITKDGQYICMHDPELSVMTNVAQHPEFADRKKTISFPDGTKETGWFVHDFTLAEIKTLRLKQRLAVRDQLYNGLFEVPTLDEALSALSARNNRLNLTVGIYIEPKHPSYFATYNLTFDGIIPILEKHGYKMKGPEARQERIYLECFEFSYLEKLRTLTDVKLIMLVGEPQNLQEDSLKPYGELFTAAGLDKLATLVQGIGPLKRWFYTSFDTEYRAKVESTQLPSITGVELVAECHRRNLHLHPWTVRNRTEDSIVDKYFQGQVYKEFKYLFDIGVDGVFSEYSGVAIAARNDYIKGRQTAELVVSAGGAVGIAVAMASIFCVIGAASYRFHLHRSATMFRALK